MSLEIIGAKHVGNDDKIRDSIPEKEFKTIFTEDRDFGLSLKIDSRFCKGFLANPVFSIITLLMELIISILPKSLIKDREIVEDLATRNNAEIKKVDATATEKIRYYDITSLILDWIVLVVVSPFVISPGAVKLLVVLFYYLAMQFAYIDFRDKIMAEKISKTYDRDLNQIAIIGNKHLPGVKMYLKNDHNIEADIFPLNYLSLEKYLDNRS